MSKIKSIDDIVREYRDSKNMIQIAQDLRTLISHTLALRHTITVQHKVIDDKQSRLLEAESEIARLKMVSGEDTRCMPNIGDMYNDREHKHNTMP